MAIELVGGALVSGFINVAFERLLSPEAAKLIRVKKLDGELVERLKIALYAAEALLVDAEHKQLDDPHVKNWLDSLRDAVYKADDLLDRVFTKAAIPKKVRTRFLNFRDRKMVSKIKEVVRRIEDLEKRKYVLGLKETARDNLSWRTPSTSLVKGNIYGRERDQEKIIKIINDNSGHQLSVIPIVGMGGVGKTTLAQCVFNNGDLTKEFDLKVWVCVSEIFDIVAITKTIIEGITRDTCNLHDFNSLQLDLKEKLSQKKFFIVLDDVWSDDGDKWNNFRAPFQYGIRGSTILLTTRRKEVASIVQTCLDPYYLDDLSEDYCWSVFADNACFPKSDGNSTLEEIGRRIVKKCKGLPLAAETLGRLLRGKHDGKEWNTVLMSDIWEFSVKNSKIIPALLISYYHLPTYLKRCFVYCSLYPKDYQFVKDELVLLWMAEDLLRPPKRGETLEEVGCECFDELASKLFFKQHRYSDEHFLIHGLLHDLAIFLAGDFYCRLEELGQAEEITIKTRHLSYGILSHPTIFFDSIDKVESLRTFLQIDSSPPSFNTKCTAYVVLSKFKYLRVLSLSTFKELDVLPDTIDELIHLRYLSLSNTSIRTLPESLCNLYNLQTLKLFGCRMLTTLPNGMHNLVNLRHLDIRETQLEEMPGRMNKLKHLQLLCYFVVGRKEDNGIKELGGLSNLHGALEIRKLENVTNSNEAMATRMLDKVHIDNLSLKWSSNDDIVPNAQIERDILDRLKPHNGLIELKLQGYRGTIFPNWVGHSSYHNITQVSLVSCSNCCMLPSLGQLPSLESLHIENFNGLKSVGVEFYENEGDHSLSTTLFPSLVNLTFYNMPCWEKWRQLDSNPFPQLMYLEIMKCPRLTGDLPNHLPALKRLYIRSCEQLIYTFPRTPAIRRLEIYGSDETRLQYLELDPETLSIVGCELVAESIFNGMTISHPACLKEIEISNYSSAISLPSNCLPKSLEKLRIRDCRKLEFPNQQQQKYDLLELRIEYSCDSLTSLSLEVFPNLKFLRITRCENLESLSMSQRQHAALHCLVIYDCPNFVSFPREGLAAPNMTYFEVIDCDKLKSLPRHMNTLLPNLERLEIHGCPEIHAFPEGGLPPNLSWLRVECHEKLLSGLSSMGNLEALTDFDIYGDCCKSVKSFPQVGSLPQLPSLTTLHLGLFSNLETLECSELLHLTSLQQLQIGWCPKLENMAGEKLPSSLLQLEIDVSPLLAERCKKKHPQLWPKISHIPSIKVNGGSVW